MKRENVLWLNDIYSNVETGSSGLGLINDAMQHTPLPCA
jgi:hypothetical protein